MFSPQKRSADLNALPWTEKHVVLKSWFSNELLEAAANPGLLQRDWWVQQSHAKCDGCWRLKYRVEIGRHCRSPFYVCLHCGTVESLYDLTGKPKHGAPQL